jgi:hypothetical protein
LRSERYSTSCLAKVDYDILRNVRIKITPETLMVFGPQQRTESSSRFPMPTFYFKYFPYYLNLSFLNMDIISITENCPGADGVLIKP